MVELKVSDTAPDVWHCNGIASHSQCDVKCRDRETPDIYLMLRCMPTTPVSCGFVSIFIIFGR